MILRCLIQDDRNLSLDCCKVFLKRGSQVSVDDKFWLNGEIQGAIKLGLIQLVGPPPSGGDFVYPEKSIAYQNTYGLRLAFECVRKSVEPGKVINIPVSMTDHPEVRNAISAGWLLDIENPAATPSPVGGSPAILEEITVKDIVGDQGTVPQARPARTQPPPIYAQQAARAQQSLAPRQPVYPPNRAPTPLVPAQSPLMQQINAQQVRAQQNPRPQVPQPPMVRQAAVNPLMQAIRSEMNQALDVVPGPIQDQRNFVPEQRPAPAVVVPRKKLVKGLHSAEDAVDDFYGKPTMVVDPGIRPTRVRELASPQAGTIDMDGHAAIPLGDAEASELTEEERLLQQIRNPSPRSGNMSAVLRSVTPSMRGPAPAVASQTAPAQAPRKREQLFSFANIFKES